METFINFKEINSLKEDIDKHILSQSRNDLTFNLFRKNHQSTLCFYENPTSPNKISANFLTHASKMQTNFDFYADIFAAVFGSIKYSFREETCDIVANFSTRHFNRQLDKCRLKIARPTFNDCLVSIGATIRSVPVSTSFAIGFTHAKSIATLCSFKSNIIEANLVGSVTEDYALLTATSLHKSGFLFCFSADLAQFHAHELQFGYVKRFDSHISQLKENTTTTDANNNTKQQKTQQNNKENNKNNSKNENEKTEIQKQTQILPNSGIFVCADLLRTSLNISGKYEFKLGTVGVKSVISSYDSPSIEAGFIIPRNAKFTIKANNKGLINMETELKPRDWLTVYLRSQTSASNAFNPVTFGWSLGISL